MVVSSEKVVTSKKSSSKSSRFVNEEAEHDKDEDADSLMDNPLSDLGEYNT